MLRIAPRNGVLLSLTMACHPMPSLVMPSPEGPAQIGAMPGTYAVWFCRHDCVAAHLATRALAYGFMVLDSVPLVDWPHAPMSRSERSLRFHALPGACYVIVGPLASGGDAARIGQSVSGWRRVAPDSVTALWFSRDIDRNYIGAIHIDSLTGRLCGVARASGYGIPFGTQGPADTVIGRRIGPPDRAICTGHLDRAV